MDKRETRANPSPDYAPPKDRVMPEKEDPHAIGNLDDAQRKLAEQVGSTGLTELQQKVTDYCKAAFGDTSFTTAMLCAQTSLASEAACQCMYELHQIGIVRMPANDGGQVLYQVMPGVVHPKSAGALRF